MRSTKTVLVTIGLLIVVAAVAAAALASGRHTQSSASQHVCGLDVVWLQSSIQGDVFEIRGGYLALKQTSNDRVHVLAHRLIKDHKKSLQDALELAHEYGIAVKLEPRPTQKWQLEEVGELSGWRFDHDYAELEVADHIQDIEEAQNEVAMGCDREIRADVAKEIPTLQQHLALAKRTLATTHDD